MNEHSASESVQAGSLYVVASPIGHLGDLSPRAAAVLAAVDWVACEDTRVSRPLLARLGARARLLAAHQHNESAAAAQIVALLGEHCSVALLSDAGTPAVSDPGARIVSAALDAGYRVVPIPGPSALTALACASGMVEGAFYFEGFLPARRTHRATKLESLSRLSSPVIIFEAPHRIADTLEAIASVCGASRWLAVGRELTKKFEEIHRLRASEALQWLQAEPMRSRGEFVLVLAPASWEPARHGPAADEGVEETVRADAADPDLLSVSLTALLAQLVPELGANRASRIIERISARPHREIYPRAVALANQLKDIDARSGA